MKKMMLFVFAIAVLLMPSSVFAGQNQTTVKTTESVGTVSEMTPDTLVMHSETSTTPMHYTFTKKTIYVDEEGTPVAMDTVTSGQPVTVYYTMDGENMMADKVMVHKTTTTTTTENPMIEKKTSTTTTTETK